MKDTASKKKKENKKVYETFSESRKRKVATKVSDNATINPKETSSAKKDYPFPILDKKAPDDYKHIPGVNSKKEAEIGYNPFGRYATYIPTQEIEGSFVRVDAYKEVTEGTQLEGLQKTVFMDRYSMRDDTGKQLEIYPEQLWRRVSRAIASVEKTDYLKKKWEDKFYAIMTDFKFVPAGRILSGAGTGALVTYYNCFVIPSPEDSRTGIIDNLKIMTEIMSRSGGVGINLSTLRPRGSYIKTVNGHSSGPMAWAQLYSVATGDVISQGGCFAPDERISTNKGLIKAKELVERIEAGEKILAQTHAGLRPITFSFRNGKKEVYTVVTKRGYKVKVTGEHKMGVIRNGKIETLELNKLAVGDETLLLLGQEINKSSVELSSNPYIRSKMSTTLNDDVHLPTSLNPDLAFLLGFSYGDGHVIKGKKVNWSADKGISLCASDDQPEVIEKLKNIIKQQFNITAVVGNGDGACKNIKFYSRVVIEWLRENGLLKDKADKICVPEKIFASPSNVVSAFIAGYYEADGCDRKSKGGYGIDSISLEMLQDIQMLLLSNGIVSHISSQTREGWNRLYRLSITGAEFKAKFSEFVNTNKDARYEGHRSHNLNYPMDVWKKLNISAKYYKGVFDSTKTRVSHYALQRIEEKLIQDDMLLEADQLRTFLHVIPDEIEAIIPSGVCDVYDFEVDGVHMLSGAGLYTSNSRRGALMLMLDDNHPDIEEFITVKKTPGMITHANLSVCISDEFMEAVKNDEDWDLLWKGEVMKTVKARHLWDMICTSAWESAEPGVVFTDRYNKMSNTWYYEDIRCTNPCVTGDTLIYTDKGLIPAKELAEQGKSLKIVSPSVLIKEKVSAQGKIISGSVNADKFDTYSTTTLKDVDKVFVTGIKEVYKLVTSEGYTVRLTADHKVLTVNGWKEAKNLVKGDKIKMLNTEGSFGLDGNEDLGKIMGWLIGNGYVNSKKNGSVVLSFFGQEQSIATSFAESVNRLINNEGKGLPHQVGVIKVKGREESRVESTSILEIVGRDIKKELKIPSIVFSGTRQMQKGFLSALFSADGSVQISIEKGVSVRLTSISEKLLEDAQKVLLNFGIASTIYRNRRNAEVRELPNHKGGKSLYECKAYHELIISHENLLRFSGEIGFVVPEKQAKLEGLLHEYIRKPYKENFLATFEALLPDGIETVYDLTEPSKHLFVANGLVVHNCGEQGLGEWQVCNLGSINLAAFVKEDGSFDYADLEYTTRTAMRFLDNVIDSCYYFFKENRDAQLSTRRTGLGTMGLADALIKMKLRYGSEEAIKVVEKIYTLMRDAAYDESSDIALEKGSFPMFIKDKYLEGNFIKQLPEKIRERIAKNGIRNAVLLSQAPTGTISLYAGVSSGIEPVFAFAMVRTDRTGTHTIYHPLFEEWKTSVAEDTDVPDYFVSSADLTPEDHVKIQAVIQKYTDSSISKTVNAPNGYSVENVKKLYRLAYDLGCKGITFYREGSRDAVLTTLDTKKTEEKKVENSIVDLRQREELLTGVTYKTHTPVGTAYITINSDSEGNIFEVFINVGKAGSDIYADATALGRLISLMFQVPSSLLSSDLVDHVINRLEDIGGASSTGFGAKRVRSLADAVAKVLAQHVGSNAIKKDLKVEQVLEEQKHQEADFCPECGQATLVKEEGCQKCYNCGFSKC